MKESRWRVLNVIQIVLVMFFIFLLFVEGFFKLETKMYINSETYDKIYERVEGDEKSVSFFGFSTYIEELESFQEWESDLRNEEHLKLEECRNMYDLPTDYARIDYNLEGSNPGFNADFCFYMLICVGAGVIAMLIFKFINIAKSERYWYPKWLIIIPYFLLLSIFAAFIVSFVKNNGMAEHSIIYGENPSVYNEVTVGSIETRFFPNIIFFIVILINIIMIIVESIIMSGAKKNKNGAQPIKKIKGNTPAQLKQYKELLDSGVINQEEFELKKNQLLNM